MQEGLQREGEFKLNIIGSKWFKVDFHCHSPASDDSPRDRSQLKYSYRDWLLGLMAQEIDCVVLSDHNTAAGLEPIRAEFALLAQEYKKNSNNRFRPLVILPAVELTAADNTHVLAIFRENISAASIEQFIGQLVLPSGQKNHELVLGMGTNAIVRAAKQNSEEIIVIPAHVDKPKGVFRNRNQSSVSEVFKEEPHAVELIDKVENLPEVYQRNLIKNLAHVKGSDAHSIEEMGNAYTWVKMTEPSFDGLKVALTDPEHCILRSPQYPPSIPSEQITKITVKSSLCKSSTNEAIEIDFSPWYTAIIGSRGSGKSTLVEAIRLGLRRDSDQYMPEDQFKTMSSFKEGAFDRESNVCIEYRKSNNLYKLEWSKSGTQLFHKNDSGDWIIEETFSVGRFPASIYSQKMLYEIATKNGAFLSVIDDSKIVNFDSWSSEKTSLEEEYKRRCSDYRSATRELSNLSVVQGQYDDVNRKLTLLRDAGLQPLQDSLRNLQSQKQKSDLAIEVIESTLISLGELKDNDKHIDTVEDGSESSQWIAEVEKIHTSLVSDLSHIIERYQQQLNALCTTPYYTLLLESISATKQELNEKVEALNSAQISPEELSSLLALELELKKKLENKVALTNNVSHTHEHKKLSYQNIIEHRKKLTQSRNKFINSLNLEDLKIRILPLASDSNSIVASYQKYSGIERFAQNIYDETNSNTLLHAFIGINKFQPDSEELRYTEIEKIKQYHEDLVKNGETHAYEGIHGSLKRRIQDISPEQIENLRCWFPDDGLEIKFKDNEEQFRQLESASPGQKSASMLSFLMSYGTDPLVLDQPEDDLDCGMLASAVIPAISKNKEKRQLIIVSHSAPIVVNGDAELVIAMKQQSKKLQPFVTGGLQDQPVRDFICDQMEGGEKAFKARFKRILG